MQNITKEKLDKYFSIAEKALEKAKASKEKINIILISQASSEHSICFAIEPQAAEKAKKIIPPKARRKLG